MSSQLFRSRTSVNDAQDRQFSSLLSTTDRRTLTKRHSIFSTWSNESYTKPKKYKPKKHKAEPPVDLDLLIPTQLKVLRCMKRFKCPGLTTRNEQFALKLPHMGMPNQLIQRIQQRKKGEFTIPKKEKLDKLLYKIKLTDKALREDQDVLEKVRSLKPEIQLNQKSKVRFYSQTPSPQKKKKKRKFSLMKTLDSGIVMADCLFV